MNSKVLWKVGVAGAALLALVCVAAAQVNDTRADVFKLQLQRFEGNFKSGGPGGSEISVKDSAKGAELVLKNSGKVGPKEITATAEYDASTKKQKATLTIDGKTYEGVVSVVGKELLLEFKRGKEATLRLRMKFKGSAEAEVKYSSQEDGKAEIDVISFTVRRAD